MQNLGALASFRSGLHLSTTQSQKGEGRFEYKIIKISDFTSSATLQYRDEKIISSNPIANNNLTQEKDILIRLKPPLIAVYITKEYEGLAFSSSMAVIRPDCTKILPQYLTYYLNSSIPQNFFQQREEGSGIPIIKLADLKELKIHLPSLKQQEKIVQFMQESDKAITLLREKIKAETSLRNESFKQLTIKGEKQ